MGPDGVKARVKKEVDGEMKEEEYTAKSLDELLAAHPELSDRIHTPGSGLRFGCTLCRSITAITRQCGAFCLGSFCFSPGWQ